MGNTITISQLYNNVKSKDKIINENLQIGQYVIVRNNGKSQIYKVIQGQEGFSLELLKLTLPTYYLRGKVKGLLVAKKDDVSYKSFNDHYFFIEN